jgi:tetratricopeptide (TPR) repeat protein
MLTAAVSTAFAQVPVPATTPAAAIKPTAPAPTAVMASTLPLNVRLWIDKDVRQVTLVGCSDDAVLVSSSAGGGAGRLEIAKIQRAMFDFEMDGLELSKAMRTNDWPGMIRIMMPALKPTLPYLALPENNAADLALEMGTYMLRSADRTSRDAKDDAQKEQAHKQYEAANDVFKQCARAEWSSVGKIGILKGCRCLLAMGKQKTAQFYINQMEEPLPGDAAYGHYWLIRGELLFREGKFAEAMDAVLKSVCFESKDVETFPDALLLSARCYEELLEPYRARDVYFEVAKLFPRTDWNKIAVDRLKIILDKGITKEKEKSPIENVFFNTGDDVNSLAEQLIKDAGKPVYFDEEEDAPAKASGKKLGVGKDEPPDENAPPAETAAPPPATPDKPAATTPTPDKTTKPTGLSKPTKTGNKSK